MEYITYKNRIAAMQNGEEVGEVTFPERDGVYVINHTLSTTACVDRASLRSWCGGRWRPSNNEAAA